MRLHGFVVVFTALVHLSLATCPDGYTMDLGSMHCIKAVDSAKTWADARAACRLEDGDLLKIPTEHNPVGGSSMLASLDKDYWIGLNDRNYEGNYRWNNEKENATYFEWGPGSPLTDEASLGSDCVSIKRIGSDAFQWDNKVCSDKKYFICERLTNEELETYKTENAAFLDVTCPSDDWTRVPGRRLCVRVPTTKYDQLTSMDVCTGLEYEHDARGKYNLLHVRDFEINDFIKGMFVTGQQWISPTDYLNEGKYRDTTLRGTGMVTYLPWKKGTTRSDDNDCVYLERGQMGKENTMVEAECMTSLKSFCQYIPRPPPPPRQDKVCPQGWQKFAPSETCFKVMGDKRMMWQNARDQCKEMDSDLAVIPNQETLDFVKGIVTPSRYWIGLQDKEKNGKFSWLGQDNEIGFSAWRNPPRNLMGDEYCVELIGRFEGMWNDKSCSAKKYSICQKDAK